MTEGVINPVRMQNWPDVFPVELSRYSNARTWAATVDATTPFVLDANPARKGLILYNPAANVVAGLYGKGAIDVNALVTFVFASSTSWTMPLPVYAGALSLLRLKGSGLVCITELS